MIGAFWKERKGMVCVEEWAAGGGLAAALTAVLAWLVRRRRKGGPKLRIQFRASLRNYSTDPPPRDRHEKEELEK